MFNVQDLGERGLLAKLQRYCPADVVGDDGAILAVDADKSLVVTTDVLVDGVHFSDRTTSAFDVGWRGTTANLSDLAAMGATPLGITVGLSLPGDLAVTWVEELYRGIKSCLDLFSTPLVGGDICRSQTISIAITAMGQVNPKRAILRSAARPGDAIVITGLHGLSRGGLELLLNPDLSQNLTPEVANRLISAHQRPLPRLDVLPYLDSLPTGKAIAGMDSSDGLADAICQICHSSGVGAIVDEENLNFYSGLIELVGKKKTREWLLYGGEDFELVLCLPKQHALMLVENIKGNTAIIGEITDAKEIEYIINRYSADTKSLNMAEGFQHFS